MDARHPHRDALGQEGTALIRARISFDGLAAVVLFAVAAAVGAAYVHTVIAAGGKPRFYQGEFGPAVMAACGRGYVNPDPAGVPGLRAFLNTDVDRFACETLPAQVPLLALSPMQQAFRYQELTVAATWRWSGVSWSGLAPLYGLFFGVTGAVTYLLLRTGMGRVLAIVGTATLIGSTIQLIYLPHLRDYSKAPFVLGAVLCLAWLVRKSMPAARLLLISAAYGLWIGVGVGFRNDLLITVPPFVVAVLFFLPGPTLGQWRLKAGAVAACLVALWLAMWPMRAIYAPGGGNSMQHVLVLGLGEPFNKDLGVDNGGLYDWGYDFKDEYAHAIAGAYAARVWGADQAPPLYGPEYDRAATAYLTAVATGFPGDMLTRIYASIIRVLAIPYNATSLQPPTLVADEQLLRGYQLRERLLRPLGAAWPWVIGLALLGLAMREPRVAAFVAFVVIYFAAYPVLQFNERHLFHLEFMAWWALGLVLQQAAVLAIGTTKAGTRSAWREAWQARRFVAPVKIGVLTAAVTAIAVLAPLWVLRHYQSGLVEARMRQYLALPREPLDLQAVPIDGGLVRLASPSQAIDARDPGTDAVQSAYLVAEFAAGACDTLAFDVTFRFHASSSFYDFSRTISVRPPLTTGGARRIFFPVYAHPRSSPVIEGAYRFAGLDLPAESASCLSGLFRVADVSGLPLMVTLNLAADWDQTTLFMTIDGLESRRDGEPHPDVYTFPAGLPVGRGLVTSDLSLVSASEIEAKSSTLRVEAGRWRVDGAGGIGGRGPFLYLAQMKARAAKQGDLVFARGRLDAGGLSVGLVKDGQWIAQVPVLKRGDFIVVIRVPDDGHYTVVVANNLPGRSLANHLTIERIGWRSGV